MEDSEADTVAKNNAELWAEKLENSCVLVVFLMYGSSPLALVTLSTTTPWR
jgi:hypothetical protein